MTIALWIFAPIGLVVVIWIAARLPFWIRDLAREERAATERAYTEAQLFGRPSGLFGNATNVVGERFVQGLAEGISGTSAEDEEEGEWESS